MRRVELTKVVQVGIDSEKYIIPAGDGFVIDVLRDVVRWTFINYCSAGVAIWFFWGNLRV